MGYMDYYGYGMGHGFGWVFMILFWVLIVLGVIAVVKLLIAPGQSGETRRPPHHSALEILNERYARGEINKEEFEQKRKDLERK